MKRVFISSATALPDYDEKQHYRAFCIHTVMKQEDGAPAVAFKGKELPWQDAFWGAPGQAGKFCVAEVNLSLLNPGDEFIPDHNKLWRCGSLGLPKLSDQHGGDGPAFSTPEGFAELLTEQWENPETKLADNLANLPTPGTVEEDDLEKGSDDPNAQSGSAWLASLVQQSWPVPQLLRLSQFVLMPESHDPAKAYLVYPDRGEGHPVKITSPRMAEKGSEEIWEVSWPDDGISFQIAHEHTVPKELASGSGNVPNFLSTKEVVGRQPDTTRFWGQELPLLFGKTLNLCEWLVRLVKEKRIDYTKFPHEAVRRTALDLLRVYGHDGLGLPSPADDAVERTKDEEAAGLFPSRFPLKEMLPVIRDRLATLEARNPALTTLLDRIGKMDAGWDPKKPPVSRAELIKELKPPDSAQWRDYVAEVLAKRLHSADDSDLDDVADPTKREEAITKRYVRRVADLSNDDDVLIELWTITWLHATVSNQKPKDAYKSISEAFDSCSATLKAAVERSGRRLAEHYGDTVARTFWRYVSRTYRREIAAENAGPYAPVFAAVKEGHSMWLKMLADGKFFPIEADVMKELASQSPDGSAPEGEKEWLEEMSLRITGSQGKQDENDKDVVVFPPAYDFHPLQLLPPGLDTSKYRGMAIFCRAVGANAKDVPRDKNLAWRCLTLGRAGYEIRRLGQQPLVSYFSHGSVTAHAADECNGIQQSYLGYRMRRIGLTEETLNTSQGVSGAAAGGGGEDRGEGFICHDLEPKNEWGLVTALRYSPKITYEFAFVAIHNSGALPKGVAKPGFPCELAAPDHIKGLLDGPSDEEFKGITLRRRYLRRVAIGSPRFNATTAALKTGELPVPPPGISLLADDLYNSEISEPDTPGVTPGVPAPRPQVIFLHDGRPDFDFNLTAPSIDRQIWRSWVLGESATMDAATTLAAATLHHLAGMGNEERKEGVVLSDPSVCGIHISLGSVFPETKAVEGLYLPLEAKTLAGQDTSEFQGKPDEYGKYLKKLDEQQKRTLKEKVIIQIADGGKPEITRSGNSGSGDVVIRVPRSQLSYLRISPCISVDDFNRFEIYPALPEEAVDANSKKSSVPDSNRTTLLNTHEGRKVVRINRAALNWRVEVAPSFKDEKDREDANRINKVAALMPLPLEIFKAVALGRNQPHGEKSYPAGNLRSSLKVDRNQELYEKWAWVSGVKTVVQKWRWNGLPQGSCGTWSGAGSDANGKPRRRGMASVLDQVDSQANPLGAHVMSDSKACGDAEISAFGNRHAEDAIGHLAKVNYADKYLGWIKDPNGWEARPIDIELHCEEGDAGRDPAYYRVRLEVTHRYAALVADPELRKKLTIHSNAEEKDKDGNTKQGTADTPWKRILLAGLEPSSLAQPRVKMVLPMMDAEAKGDDARPGFAVLTRDSLPSPFHRLIATLEIADYRTYKDDLIATVDLLHEIGPDPVTSKRGSGIDPKTIERGQLEGAKPPEKKPVLVNVEDEELDWEEEAVRGAKEKIAVTIEGEPFGLSWEREAGSPLFPHAGFFFDMVEIAKLAGIPLDDPKDKSSKPPENTLKKMLASDLMAKLRFRWQIDRSALWSAGNPFKNQYFQGKESGAWWVRSLAPFRLDYKRDASKGDLQFQYDPHGATSPTSNASLSFYQGDEPLSSVPRFAEYDSVGTNKDDTELCSALVFICWADISDGTSNRGSRTVADAFLVDVRLPGPSVPPPAPVPLMNHGGGKKVSGGQFFLLHFRGTMYDDKFDPEKDVRPRLSTLLYRWITQPDAKHGKFGPSFDLLSEYLFTGPYAEDFKSTATAPDGKPLLYGDGSKYTPDAQGMVVRSSPTLSHISR